jgi:hypothetical protein
LSASQSLRNYAISRANRSGIPIASSIRVRISPIARAALTLMLLVTSARRVHAHTIEEPDAVTQEWNRCLRLVHVAASRRHHQTKSAVTAYPRVTL